LEHIDKIEIPNGERVNEPNSNHGDYSSNIGNPTDTSWEEVRMIAKRTAKDSVFRDLFKIPKYLLELYQSLHPEDTETTEIKEHGRTRKAVLETIRICKDKEILKEYLEDREKEVVDIMMTLFDDEYILKTYVEEKTQAAAKEAADQAKMEEKQRTALRMAKKGTAVDAIADFLDVSISLVKKWLDGSVTLAK
jgi:hypothetical protein